LEIWVVCIDDNVISVERQSRDKASDICNAERVACIDVGDVFGQIEANLTRAFSGST
jgi:hypothetical protein